MSKQNAVIPKTTDDVDVMTFMAMFGLLDSPIILTYQNLGFKPNWCHVSAKAQAVRAGGKRVHGWALWKFPKGLMAEFHSVWEDKNGDLIDVTPPKFGKKVMFVRDNKEVIYEINGVFSQPADRMPIPSQKYWHNGHPLEGETWGFNTTEENFLAYCDSLGFDPAKYPTDKILG